jgi:hypothetical protein
LNCNEHQLEKFLNGGIRHTDSRLRFLLHLDECPRCWNAVFQATRAEHPHWYRRMSTARGRESVDYQFGDAA